MGLHDRDYYRRPPPARFTLPAVRTWSVTTWLVAVNVAVYLVNTVWFSTAGVGGGLYVRGLPVLWRLGYFSIDAALGHYQFWRFLTFQFLHSYDGPGHVLFNMVALFFFGPLVEPVLGRARFLAFYLLSGVAGAVSLCLCHVIGLSFAGATVPLVGASAGIFGVLVAAAVVAPDAILVVAGVWSVPARVGAGVMIVVAAVTVLTGGLNAGGEAAHLGGAAAGYALVVNPRVLDVFAPHRRMRWTGRRGR